MASKKGVKKSALTYKDNFWSNKRVEQGIKIEEIVEYLKLQGISKCMSAIGMYFTGQQLPQQYVSDAICEMFGVDKSTGWLEFQHAHREWKSENDNKTLVKSAKKPYVYKRGPRKNKHVIGKIGPHVAEVPSNNIMAEKAYNESIVKGILANRKDMVLDIVYGKVDRDTYKKIEKVFEVKL